MKVSENTLRKLNFLDVQQALVERAHSSLGKELALSLMPSLSQAEIVLSWERLEEAINGPALSLGGVHDIRDLIERVREGKIIEGRDILQIAYTMDAAGNIKRAILNSNRAKLAELAAQMSSFDGALRLVREQLDENGNVRDDATPKLRDIRRRLNPLRGRIRDRLQQLLDRYSESVQDPIITQRRDRYVIPIRANAQSKVPGIVLDSSDSGATVFMEPQSVVPMNNELALLEFEERDEVRRILIALSQRLAYEEGLEPSLKVLAQLDFIAAGARLIKDWKLAKPHFAERFQLVEACHPLIENCIANTIELNTDKRLLIITGPNAGGKTVLIKTLGLATLMAHAGLFWPCSQEQASQLPFIEAIYSDIGDEQSIEASLSTYAGHLMHLKEIVEQAAPGVLVLIDELGSGTDPAEGAALSQAILEQVLDSGALALVTTHLAPLKVFASEQQHVQNAAMAFDLEHLRPKFQLVLGQPGRSYALAIAERLGLKKTLLERAETLLGPEGAELEQLLETLEQQRLQLNQDVAEAQEAHEQARLEAELLRKQITKLRENESDVMAAAAEKAELMLQDTLRQASELRRKAQEQPEERSQALEGIRQLRQEAKKTVAKGKKKGQPQQQAKFRPGVAVFVPEYQAEGQIIEERGEDLLIQLGLLKLTIAKRDVQLAKPKAKPTGSYTSVAAPARFERELNIRGERVEQGLELIRDFILEARSLKVSPIRILHGKGTGTLRDAVRNYLKTDKAVLRFEDAVPYEGGHGVTVAHLRL